MTAYWGGQLFRRDKPHQRPFVTLGTRKSMEKQNVIAVPTSTNEIQGTCALFITLAIEESRITKTPAAISAYSIQ